MMQTLKILIVVAVLAGGGWWLVNHNDNVRDFVNSYVENGEFLTLEARFTPEQIMRLHRHKLVLDKNHTLQEPSLRFYPYLLLDVKYTDDGNLTREGVLLWSMVDGEMVLDTESWDTTHGFEDALNAKATRSDFKVMQALAKNGNALSRDQLLTVLNIDAESVDNWIESARRKYLIIQKGNEISLHFQDPKILVTPQTKIHQWLVTKPYNHAQRMPKRYSRSQIERTARAAFGNDFTIRDGKVVFLPVYRLEVLNPDESLLTSDWNALNGQRIQTKSFVPIP